MRALVALLLALSTPALAEPTTLRIATVAPEGTSWAREVRAWARGVESATDGAVRAKIYFGGIAGDEMKVLERIHRDQLDGTIGSEVCTRLSPSLKVGRVVGVFQSRDENAYVLQRLRPIVDAEMLRAGFINLGEAGLGPELLFTRESVPDLAALKRMRLWIWDTDDVLPPQVRAIGLNVAQSPLERAAREFDERRFDGFITVPSAALAFQWSTQVRHLTAMRISFRSACLIIAARAFDALPIEVQQALRASEEKLRVHIEELGRREDDALLGGLLAKHGLIAAQPSATLRGEFLAAARQVRPGAQVVSADLLGQVMQWLADYRAEHAAR